MKIETTLTAICPKCGQTYHERPAISRTDNKTPICPDCGTREALQGLGISTAEQEEIIDAIHRSMSRGKGGNA